MTKSAILLLALGAVMRGAPASAASQGQEAEAGAVFPARSEAVTVDVLVLDREGHPIKGLTRDDFVVREDGAPRPVVAFREVIPGTAPAVARGEASAIATNDDARPEQGRVFLVVFDDVHLTPITAWRAQSALNRFLDTSVHAGDHVTLLATSSGVRRSARLPEGLASLHAWVSARKGRRMRHLAEETGGQVFRAESADRLDELFLGVLSRIKNRYLLRYEPVGVKAGGWHKLGVRLRDKSGEVRSRRGYLVAAPPQLPTTPRAGP